MGHGVKNERWTRVKVIEHKEKHVIPFDQIKTQIESYLNAAAHDREMQILKSRLWKSGGVKILISEDKS